MRIVFADSVYWIALSNPRDQWHGLVKEVSQSLMRCRIFTTEEILTEFLNYYAERGKGSRDVATRMVRKLLVNPNVTVQPQSRDSFRAGLDLYERRSDKGYSLTDCISMHHMRELGMTDILTADHHFRQEGFTALLAQ